MPTDKFSFGLNRLCVIALLNRSDSYGYRISRELPEALVMSEPTLYPILKQFERQGAIESYGRQENGRLRRYYRLTVEGKEMCDTAKRQWQTLCRWMDLKLSSSTGS